MKKTLKSIQKKHGMLNEAYAWERTSGGALPTLADVQAKYNAKSVNEQEIQSLNENINVQDILDNGKLPDGKTTGTYKIVQLKEPQVINGKTYNFELFLDDNVKLI